MWYVTFDGSACSSPMRIARYDYSATAGDCHRGEACELLKYITFYGFFQRLILKMNYIGFKSHKKPVLTFKKHAISSVNKRDRH